MASRAEVKFDISAGGIFNHIELILEKIRCQLDPIGVQHVICGNTELDSIT